MFLSTIRTRWFSLSVFAALVSSLVAAPPVAAQEGDIAITGSAAIITVVDGPPGAAGDGDAGDPGGGGGGWLYRCSWLDTWGGAEVGLGLANTLIPGVSYYVTCVTNDADQLPHPVLSPAILVYDPADPVPGVTDSVDVARAVRDQGLVQPPPLGVGMSPQDRQITGLETWLWPDGSTAFVQGSASAGALTVTVRGIYQATTFDVGEAGVAPIVCEDATEWTEGADDPTCSHTYLTEEAGRVVGAESEWLYVWSDNAAQPAWVAWESVSLVEQLTIDVVDIEAVISGSE